MAKLHTPTNLLSKSPSFRISHTANNTISHDPLPLFSHTALPKGGLAFIGGPVSALSFHPNAPGICLTAAHNTTNPTHILHQCYEGPAVIQLWHFSLSKNSPSTKCLGLIPHNGDCTFDLKWRPDKSRYLPQNWSGTFAAALGDGSVIVCHLDADHIPFVDHSARESAPLLEPTTIVLRRNNARSPVRVVEWSPDGKRLVVGSANGNVEVYEADSNDACWPSWTIPAQESVISDIRWLSPQLYCTLGMSCVLRLCDVRDPIATLEQNCEGLQGSLSMAMVEPYVAVVGADSGYLRVVRLSAIDQVTAQNPVRRVYLQTSSFRDMRSVSLSDMTVLYTGGSEGILHQVVFPKPLWPVKGACKIDKTRISEKLRWRSNGDVMHLQLNPPPPKEKVKKKRGAVGRDSKGTPGPLFGQRYKQPIVVTRIAVNAQNNAIAVGVDGGFVTWLPINTTSGSHATPVVEEDAHMFSTTHVSTNGLVRQPEEANGDVVSLDQSSSLQNIPFKVKLKKEAKRPVYGPKRRRGRPRKLATDDTPRTGRREKLTEHDTDSKTDTVYAPKNTAKRVSASRDEAETLAPVSAPSRTRKRRRAGNDDDTAAAEPVQVVEEPTTHDKPKTRKRRRTRASDSTPQEAVAPEAKDARANQAREETVPSQNTEEADGVKANPHGATPRTTSPSGPSTKRTKSQSSSLEQRVQHGISIPLRLHVRKPTKREKQASGKRKSLASELSEPPPPSRKSARRSTWSARAPSSDLSATPKISATAEALDAPAEPDANLRSLAAKASHSEPPGKPVVSVTGTESYLPSKPDVSKRATSISPTKPDVGARASTADRPRPVKLVVRRRSSPSNPPPIRTGSPPDDGPTSGLNEELSSVPARLRIRKRRADEMIEPTVWRERAPKRSKTDPQVADQATHSGGVADDSKISPDGAAQGQDAGSARSRRVRKPSWRVRGD